jgi:hypothetical protein
MTFWVFKYGRNDLYSCDNWRFIRDCQRRLGRVRPGKSHFQKTYPFETGFGTLTSGLRIHLS